ncbi:hypothetical protein PSHT_00667 [Puccinia striiformis]|uniref:Uncharacterized protein n=1 Tax=Puccinia striiformis TaxID=27350 RepID=A0A2S4WMG8_9BASI|nr:hypothetical protein PSHT_00667 [Puccinia striiformis]
MVKGSDMSVPSSHQITGVFLVKWLDRFDGRALILILVAVIFPPAAAIFVAGCGCDLLINILLTSLGYLPGQPELFLLSLCSISRSTDSFEVDQTNLCDSISSSSCTKPPYIGHLHAFYLIYKRMQAEERYGQEGYKYEPIGYQQPVNQHPPLLHQASAPPAYGSAV